MRFVSTALVMIAMALMLLALMMLTPNVRAKRTVAEPRAHRLCCRRGTLGLSSSLDGFPRPRPQSLWAGFSFLANDRPGSASRSFLRVRD
jgi:hypothetical protein